MLIFTSYSHLDKKLHQGFGRAIAALKRELGVEHWHDGVMLPGGTFPDEIARALEAADVVVLLISANFFVSDYCYLVEMQAAMKRRAAGGCAVVPVIVDFVEGWDAGEVGALVALPTDGKPVRAFSPQSKGWADVVKGLRRIIEERPKPQAGRTHHLPIQRNEMFTGREDDLAWITDKLAAGKPVALLHGMGGVGKTQTAAEFARHHADTYTVVWWVAAETGTEADTGYGALAEALSLPGYDPRDAAKTRQAVTAWMERETGWLVVLDNAESPESLRPWLPANPKGHLLITSRNPGWHNRAAVRDVDVWPTDVAAGFLIERSGDHDRAAAEVLTEKLGGLPLACEQAGAYIRETGCGLAGYAERLEKQAGKLLDRMSKSGDYPRSLAASVTLSVGEAAKESPLAVEILRVLAWLAPDGIPRWLLDGWEADALDVDEALAVLGRRALLRRADGGLAVHRLTQRILRDVEPDEDTDASAAAIRLLSVVCVANTQHDVYLWPRYASLLPHAGWLFARLPDTSPEAAAASVVCTNIGMYVRSARGDYASALPWYERALALTEAHFGPDHPDIAVDLSNLGEALLRVGGLQAAKLCFQRALAVTEAALGAEHRDVADSLSGLGAVLRDLGELDEARSCLARSLKIREAAFRYDHPVVAAALSNFAYVLQDQGEMDGAREHFQRALDITRSSPYRGSNHPETGQRHNNLGYHLYRMGDNGSAESHLRQALVIRQKHLDPGHPDIQATGSWLNIVREALGKPPLGEDGEEGAAG